MVLLILYKLLLVVQMKKIIITSILLISLSACVSTPRPYEKDYAAPTELNNWAANASLKELCRGLKSWRNPDAKQRALIEFSRRNINTQYCYRYSGFSILP